MDDFERAVVLTFQFTGGVDVNLKAQADAYVANLKKSPDCWRLCVERFSVTGYPEVKFWVLQTLHEVRQLSR
jgi:exportin-T